MAVLVAAVVSSAQCGRASRRLSAPAAPTTITLLGPELAAKPGEASQFEAIGHYPTGPTADLTALARWESSNPAVAVVAPGGVVTALAPGDAWIGATYGRVTGWLRFVVVATEALSRPRISSGRTASQRRDVAAAPSRPEATSTPAPLAMPSGARPAGGAPGGSAPSGSAQAGYGGSGAGATASQPQVHDWGGTLSALGRGVWADVTLASTPARQTAESLYLWRAVIYAVWLVLGGMLIVGSVRRLVRGSGFIGPLFLLSVGMCVSLLGPSFARVWGPVYDLAQIATVLICLLVGLPALSLATFGSRSRLFRQSRRFYVAILGGFVLALLWAIWSLERNPPLM